MDVRIHRWPDYGPCRVSRRKMDAALRLIRNWE
jgi:hypothetical protein